MRHLGAILRQKGARGGLDQCVPEFLTPILGSFWGPKLFFVIAGIIFWTSFFTLVGPLWGPFWGAFWVQIGPRRGQDGPKRGTKSFKHPKSCIGKNLEKTICFSRFLRSRGFPREAPEAHEGSQEAPKELQNLKNNRSKNRPQSFQFFHNF